jgi:hypothetical protein
VSRHTEAHHDAGRGDVHYLGNKCVLLQDDPAFKIAVASVKVSGMKNRDLFLSKDRLNFRFECLPRIISGEISRNRRYGVLRVFAAIVQITRQHEYSSPSKSSECQDGAVLP